MIKAEELYSLYYKYCDLWYHDHDKEDGEPVCYQEFLDNEAQDPEILEEIRKDFDELYAQ